MVTPSSCKNPPKNMQTTFSKQTNMNEKQNYNKNGEKQKLGFLLSKKLRTSSNLVKL